MRTAIIVLAVLFSTAALFVTALTLTISLRDGGAPSPVPVRQPLAVPDYRTQSPPLRPPGPLPFETVPAARPLPEYSGAETPLPGEPENPAEPASVTAAPPEAPPFRLETGNGERGRVIALLGGGLFPPGQEGLSPEFLVAVQQALPEIVLSPGARIVVEGHTENTPTRSGPDGKFVDNRVLSLQRAEAVARLLEQEGVDARRISIAGYGDTHPLAPNTLEGGRDENRRVEIRLIPGPGEPGDVGGE